MWLLLRSGIKGFSVSYDFLFCVCTEMDCYKVKSRYKLLMIYLAGVLNNIQVAAISLYIATNFTGLSMMLFMVALVNLQMAMLNILPIKNLDGMYIIELIVGAEELFTVRYKKKWMEIFRKTNFAVLIMFTTASIIVINYDGKWCILMFFIALIAYVGYSPACKGQESISLFVLIAMASIPINIEMVRLLSPIVGLLFSNNIATLVGAGVIYLDLFSVEEIAMGILGRLMWKNQMLDVEEEMDYV